MFYERPLPVPARQRGTIIDDLLYGLLDVDDLLDDLLDPFQW